MMRKLLLVVWCVKLADEKPLHPEFTAQYIFSSSKSIKNPSIKFSPIVKQAIEKNKIHEPEFASTTNISFSAPEEFDSLNHESGYSMLSKTFTKSKKDRNDHDSKYILDKRVLYHSLTNPLFKSKALNFKDENDFPRLVGDVYKITSPFESNWIFSPKLTKLIENERKTLMDEFLNKFNTLKIDNWKEPLKQQKSFSDSPSDSIFPAPSNLDLEHYHNKLDTNTVDSLENLGKDQFDENIKDSAIIFKDLKGSSILDDLNDKPHLEGVTPKDSYVGYNVQEVKTPQGVQGVMKIFDKNGLAQKIHYNENGVMNESTAHNSVPQNNKSAPNKHKNSTGLHNVIKSAVSELKPPVNKKLGSQQNKTAIKNNINSVTKKVTSPEIKNVSLKIEGYDSHNSSSPQVRISNAINELKNPENILSDFLEQFNGATDISNNGNVRTDVHNTFHETVSEKSYSYT